MRNPYENYQQIRYFRYCTGKYQCHGSIRHCLGEDLPEIPGELAVYVERRQDRMPV